MFVLPIRMSFLLEKIRGIKGVDRLSEDADRISLEIAENKLSIVDLHAAIVASGAEIAMYQPEAMDMESAFMKLTKGKVR